MLSPAIRTGVVAPCRPLFRSSASHVFLLSSFHLFLSSLPALIPIFSPFSLQSSMSPNSCLMPPNTQSSFHPLPISCFVCKPQGREMGEKHSPCTTVTKDRWVIAIYVPVSLLPQKKKKQHMYTWKKTKSLRLPLTCCAFTGTDAPALPSTHTCTVTKKPTDIWL